MTTFPKPLTTVSENTPEFLTLPMITPTGFREYDARWRFPEEINLVGIQAVGLGLGTMLQKIGKARIVVGCDYRAYSLSVKQALTLGLMTAGCEVQDVGICLSPTVYFSQFDLDIPAGAMVTASHNPNGWTGVKIGADRPLTFGPSEMAELRDTVLEGKGVAAAGGSYQMVQGFADRYLDDVVGETKLSRKLKVVCATGNGSASMFAPQMLERIGAEVIPLHTTPDYDFPNYNPNPEAMEMLHSMRDKVLETGADLAVGFDGDGDRCGVVDDEGEEIFADKVGVMLARSWSKDHPGATIVADVKSTGLFASDPVLKEAGIVADYWMTGHSHMKRRVHELGALAGIEKSGHYFLAGDLGRGYDDGLVVAREICLMLDRAGGKMSDLRKELPPVWTTPTMSPYCSDLEKYDTIKKIVSAFEEMAANGASIAGSKIVKVTTINGARVQLENGGWTLVRASSNTPNLVVVCESPNSEAEMRKIFEDTRAFLDGYSEIGEYDQTL